MIKLYYSGATQVDDLQTNPDKSLGAYRSGSVVPNDQLNNLFTLISERAKTESSRETRGIFIKNELTDSYINNIRLYVNYPLNQNLIVGWNKIDYPVLYIVENLGILNIYGTEQDSIDNTNILGTVDYSGVTSYPSKITITGTISGQFILNEQPVSGSRFEETTKNQAKILISAVEVGDSEKMELLQSQKSVPYYADFIEPLGVENEVTLTETMYPESSLGLWIQRDVDKVEYVDCEEMEEYLSNLESEEEIEFVFTWDDPLDAIQLTPDTTDNDVDNNISITFTDDISWRDNIDELYVDDQLINGALYSLTAGNLTIQSVVFDSVGTYEIIIRSVGYTDSTIDQEIV